VIDDPAVRRVAVALIRAGNAAQIRDDATDDEVLWQFGKTAEPLAAALVDVIRDEVRAGRIA
jgi:hypothetical protein